LPSRCQQVADGEISSTPASRTINLEDAPPYDLPQGWTLAGAPPALHGSQTDNVPARTRYARRYHAERWGVVASAAYSDVTLEHSFDGMGQYTGELVGETSDNTTLGWGSSTPMAALRFRRGVCCSTRRSAIRGSDGLHSPAVGF